MAKSNASKDKNKEAGAVKRYFRGVRSEFKKVIWPTKSQLANYSVIVIVVSIITAVVIYAVDFVVQQIFSLFLG